MPHKSQLTWDRYLRRRSPVLQRDKQRMESLDAGAELAVQQRVRMRRFAVAQPIDRERRIALLGGKLLVGVFERHVSPRGAVPVFFREAGAMG